MVEVVGQRVVDEVHLHPWLDILIDQALVVCQIRTRLIRLMGLRMGQELQEARLGQEQAHLGPLAPRTGLSRGPRRSWGLHRRGPMDRRPS